MINEGKKSRGQEVKQISSLRGGFSGGRRVSVANPARKVAFGRYSDATPNNPIEQSEAVVIHTTPHPTLSHKGRGNKKVAFTLAEVLITLGIIGVVAAMTLPSLIQKHQERVTVNKLKKFYSEFSQAYAMAVMENGTLDNWGLVASAMDTDEEGNSIHTEQSLEQYDKFFGIIEKYLKNIEKKKFANNVKLYKKKYYVLPDGMIITGMWLSAPERCNSAQNPDFYCGDFYVSTKYGKTSSLKNVFCFKISPNRIYPFGTGNDFNNLCLSGKNYTRCTAWVILNGNMDYLHCNDLSWNGKTKCE